MAGVPAPGLPERTHVEHQREPCPHRIIDDAGGAFAMGAIGGSIWHFFRGAKNSPRGARVAGALDAVKLRAPVIGGQFAVWGLLYSTFDCCLQGVRRKEDPWNSVASGAMAGGILAARHGARAMGKSAVGAGLLLGLIEGMSVVLGRYAGPAQPPEAPDGMQAVREEIAQAREKARADGLAGVGAWATAEGAEV